MQHFRGSLTRLKTLMEQKLPDGNDIYGYPGVTKLSLVEALDVAYALSLEIKEDSESRFEVISLKRTGSDLYKSLKDFIETDFAEKDEQIHFNNFLNSLSTLIEKTKITYFIVAKHGMRDDVELAKIRATIDGLTLLGDELKEKKDAIASEVETISTAVDGVNTSYKTAKQLSSDIKEWHDKASTQYSEIAETHEAIDGWDKEIQRCSAQFQTQSKQIADLATTTTKGLNKLNSSAADGEKHVEELKKTTRDHHKLLDEIRQTLEGANRVGMAASFKARKDELRWQQITWQIVFIAAITLIVVAVWRLVLPTITGEAGRWTEIIAELGIVSPLIWLGWLAAKQYGYTSKIREDYAFKSAAAMAYEGHKKAARESDKNLERLLLEFSLFNMAQNPIRLYGEGDVHGTPIHEVAAQVLNKFPRFKKASAEVPSIGRLAVSTEESEKTRVKE